MSQNGKSGQTLLLAVLIGAILIISIPIVIFLNQTGAFHQAAAQKRSRGRALAEEGIAYAIRQLSASQATWTAAQGNSFIGTDCNTGVQIPSLAGGSFELSCGFTGVANPGLQPYEVPVTVVAYLPDNFGKLSSVRAMKAYLGQRTLGTDLANDLHAGAALQLMLNPILPTQAIPPLVVQWGPIISFDTTGTPWSLADPLDHVNSGGKDFVGFPRMFSEGGIAGTWYSGTGPNPTYPRTGATTASSVTTDQKEYWAFASQTFPPLINEAGYLATATTELGAYPVVGCGGIGCPPGTIVQTQGNYVVSPGAVAMFNNSYVPPSNQSVIYVQGDAELDNTALDLGGNGGAFIVTGNLTLGASGGGQVLANLRVPNTAPLEYYYWNQAGPPLWPGANYVVAGTMSSANAQSPFASSLGNVQFRGFLYVKGNLIVNGPNWNISGCVLVGDMNAAGSTNGQLTINTGDNLTLAYDDYINHYNVHVSPISGTTAIKVVPDFLEDIPTP